MKKQLKYAIPFVMIFLLLPTFSTSIGIYIYGPPSLNWEINIGDTHYFTAGWAVDLDLGDTAWEMLDEYLDLIDPALDAHTLYADLMNVESVYNFRIIITNISSYFYNSTPSYNYTRDVIEGDMAWKAASMSDYGSLNGTMVYEILQNAMLFNAYSTLFDWGVSSSEVIEQLEMFGPEFTEYYQEWTTDNSGEARDQPNGLPVFIHQDWSLEGFYDEMRGNFNETHFEYFTNQTGVTITSWDDLTSALGFTSIRINNRDATVKFKLSSMDTKLLDLYVNNTGFYDNGTKIETYSALLDFLNITEFDAEARFDVEWSRKGVLTNFHAQSDFTGKYEGEKFKVSPQFDVSYGEHDRINAKFTVPGYPILLVILAGTATVSVVIVRIKRRKK